MGAGSFFQMGQHSCPEILCEYAIPTERDCTLRRGSELTGHQTHQPKEHDMSKGIHTTKTGELVFVTPLGENHYRLDYSDGRVTFI